MPCFRASFRGWFRGGKNTHPGQGDEPKQAEMMEAGGGRTSSELDRMFESAGATHARSRDVANRTGALNHDNPPAANQPRKQDQDNGYGRPSGEPSAGAVESECIATTTDINEQLPANANDAPMPEEGVSPECDPCHHILGLKLGKSEAKLHKMKRRHEDLAMRCEELRSSNDSFLWENENLQISNESLGKEVTRIGEENRSLTDRFLDERDDKNRAAEEQQRLNVLLQAERQENKMLLAKCNEYKGIIAASKILPPSVPNSQAKYLNSHQEIQAEIKQTLTVCVSEWAEGMCAQLGTHVSIVPQLLATIFSESQAEVERRRLEVHAFFLCGSDVPTTTTMDQDTAEFMLKHMRLYFKEIFPLTGKNVEEACDRIANELAEPIRVALGSAALEEAGKLFRANSLRKIIKSYLYILVCATLQHPRTKFRGDCGQEQYFDPQIHAPSIDGDALLPGDKCVVVFPAMKAEASDKGYILRAVEW